MKFLQNNSIQKRYYFYDSVSFSTLTNAFKTNNQNNQQKLPIYDLKMVRDQLPKIQYNESINTQSEQKSQNILKMSLEYKYRNKNNELNNSKDTIQLSEQKEFKERSLTCYIQNIDKSDFQKSEKQIKKQIKNYQDFTNDGFNDYLDEVKRKNRKNNKLDQEISQLINEIKGQEFVITKKIKRLPLQNSQDAMNSKKWILKDSTKQSIKLLNSDQNQQTLQPIKIDQKSSVNRSIKFISDHQASQIKNESLKILLSNLKENSNSDRILKIPSEESVQNCINQIIKGIKELFIILIRKKLVTAILKELGASGKKLNNIFFSKNLLKDNINTSDFEDILFQDFKQNRLDAWQDLVYFQSNMQEYLLKKAQLNLHQIERSVKEEQREINELKQTLDKKQVMNSLSFNGQDTYQQLFKKLEIENENNRHTDFNSYMGRVENGMMEDLFRIERKYGQCEIISQQSRAVNQYLNESVIRMRLNQNQ